MRVRGTAPVTWLARLGLFVFWLFGTTLVVAVSLYFAGCGPALSPRQRTLYSVEVTHCLANEHDIVIEPCGELSAEACEARDLAALSAERARCDAALDAIEHGGP